MFKLKGPGLFGTTSKEEPSGPFESAGLFGSSKKPESSGSSEATGLFGSPKRQERGSIFGKPASQSSDIAKSKSLFTAPAPPLAFGSQEGTEKREPGSRPNSPTGQQSFSTGTLFGGPVGQPEVNLRKLEEDLAKKASNAQGGASSPTQGDDETRVLLEESMERVSTLEADNEKLKTENEELQKISALKEDSAKVVSKTARAKIQKYEDEKKKLELELQRIGQASTASSSEEQDLPLKAIMSQLKSTEDNNEKLESDLFAAQQEMEMLEEQLENLERERQEAQTETKVASPNKQNMVVGIQSLGANNVTIKDKQLIVRGPDQAAATEIAQLLSTGAAKLATLDGKQVLLTTAPAKAGQQSAGATPTAPPPGESTPPSQRQENYNAELLSIQRSTHDEKEVLEQRLAKAEENTKRLEKELLTKSQEEKNIDQLKIQNELLTKNNEEQQKLLKEKTEQITVLETCAEKLRNEKSGLQKYQQGITTQTQTLEREKSILKSDRNELQEKLSEAMKEKSQMRSKQRMHFAMVDAGLDNIIQETETPEWVKSSLKVLKRCSQQFLDENAEIEEPPKKIAKIESTPSKTEKLCIKDEPKQEYMEQVEDIKMKIEKEEIKGND